MSVIVDKITTLFDECKSYGRSNNKYGTRVLSSCDKAVSNAAKSHRPGDEKTIKKTSYSRHGSNSFLDNNEESAVNREDVDSREKLSRDIESLIMGTKIRTASVEFASLSKMLALSYLAAGNEIMAIGHLTESHASILQQHIFHRYTKTQVRKQYLNQPQESGLRPIYMKFDSKSTNGADSLRAKLAKMPQEWYMVQVTVGYEEPYPLKVNDSVLDSVHSLHITVLPTGNDAIEPFCVTVPGHKDKRDYREYDGLKEIVAIQKTNKSDLEAYYADNKSYWRMREKQNNRMKTAVKELEYTWLREWRILLMADPLEESPLVNEIRGMIDKLIADDLSVIALSPRSRWLLRKIATSSFYLTKAEIARAVNHILGKYNKLANNVILSIYGKLKNVDNLRTEKRKTLIMIVDESIDHVPFETIDVLKNHPVTRFPSFHIAHAMFKEHEADIVGGCKIVKIHDDFGTFIINPARNLAKMEKRMKLFVDYWMPDWKGKYGTEPDEDSFEKVLVNYDVLMYSGHGSGIQYLPGEKIERLRVRATVLLFGCSSVKLHSSGGRFPPYGISNQYLIACGPCVLGMLWEVTDGDIDRMTARFISDWIPTVDNRSWSNVDVNKWCDGVLKFASPSKTVSSSKSTSEPELLRAVAKSRQVCTQHMTSAAIVVRGLPIKLE